MSWNERAACRGMNVDIFVSPNTTHNRHPDYTTARAVCARCEVRAECLAESKGALGMWGGLDEAERRGNARRPRAQRIDSRIPELLEGWVSTRQVADRLKISEHTARQALRRLHADGVIARSRHAGYVVWTNR